jgi:DNA mismatch repair protein MSH5
MSYITRRKNIEYLPGDISALHAFQIRTIEMFTLTDMMFVNVDTLTSLQIIQSENHPNSHMQGPATSGAKESLSVYGLFHHLARTPQGRQRLRRMFLRPSLDVAVIEERLNTIAVFLRPENEPSLQKLTWCLSKIRDIRTVIIHLQKGMRDVSAKGGGIRKGVWASIQAFTFHVLQILEAVHELSDGRDLAITSKMLQEIEPISINEIGKIITSVVDFERSGEQHRTVVQQGVDAELDGMKSVYDGLDDLLSKVATRLSANLPEWATQYVENCIFFPQLGFLTVVPLDPITGRGKYEGEGVDNDFWERKFVSNDMGYYKNQYMNEMDSHFGDLYGKICGML